MFHFFNPLNQCGFANGAINYLDQYPGDSSYRIVIPIKILNENTPSIQAIIDTGTPYCIIDPEILAEYYQSFQENEKTAIYIRGNHVSGSLGRIPIILLAQTGNSIEIEATVFCPSSEITNWPFPNFIGLSGFLDRIRFAIDPAENCLYFSMTNNP